MRNRERSPAAMASSRRSRTVHGNAIKRLSDGEPGCREVVTVLKIKPELRLDSKVTTEPQGRIRPAPRAQYARCACAGLRKLLPRHKATISAARETPRAKPLRDGAALALQRCGAFLSSARTSMIIDDFNVLGGRQESNESKSA